MKRTVAIFVLMDALGFEYVKERRFLDGVVVIKVPCRTVLGYSSSAIPSILSGKYPFETGHWNYYYFSPKTSLWKWTRPFSWLPLERIPKAGGLVAHLISVKSWKWSGYTGYFQHCAIPLRYRWLFDYNEKKSVFYDGLISGETIFSVLRKMRVSFFLRTFPTPDQQAFAEAIRSVQRQEYYVYFLYLSEMDGVLHEFCNEPSVVDEKIAWYDEQIRQLYKTALESFQEVHLYVFSDHGMTPIVGTFDLIGEIEKLRLNIPKHYVPFYDSTMARFWFFREEAKHKVSDALMRLGVGHILSKEEMIRFGVYFPDRKFGDMVFLMNPGYVIAPSYISKSALKGMHGFSPDDKWSDAVFMSNIQLDSEPRSILDFHRIMLQEVRGIDLDTSHRGSV